MSEQIRRYTSLGVGPIPCDNGLFVLHSGHVAARAADKAEIERLRADNVRLNNTVHAVGQCIPRTEKELSSRIAELSAYIRELEDECNLRGSRITELEAGRGYAYAKAIAEWRTAFGIPGNRSNATVDWIERRAAEIAAKGEDG